MFKRKKRKHPVKTSSVRFSYPNQEVLRDITLSTKKSEIVAIIGKSGSGKSTFLKILSGIINTNYGGRIRIFNKPRFLKKDKIGFVPQELSFIPDLNLEDNIKIIGLCFGLTEAKALQKADEYLNLLKISEPLTKKPSELSGGQKVRFNIVLSLLHEPEILILDEPFVGLDFKNRRLLWHFLEKMKKAGKSIILTSHLLTEIQEHVDRIVLLENGRVFFSGNLEKLKQKLKINYLFEVKFSRLSKENLNKIKKYCTYKDIPLLDFYERYMMFGIHSNIQKTYLTKFLIKLIPDMVEKSFREPNLDEIFMKE
jgi:ABC-2 type transport system ATP-binding protein